MPTQTEFSVFLIITWHCLNGRIFIYSFPAFWMACSCVQSLLPLYKTFCRYHALLIGIYCL
ncbi:Protein of unknown function [Pyronema omphalodes CBS 100304]|uniref:Uncharacterized protein n=1 Tax=Pyronema omphalodes (strain CBS 100304) TaxID=1076935 RepID=U4L0N2_PYROM|nr:Protein of unknown function [Pyronema omphalodes CBS 100304]